MNKYNSVYSECGGQILHEVKRRRRHVEALTGQITRNSDGGGTEITVEQCVTSTTGVINCITSSSPVSEIVVAEHLHASQAHRKLPFSFYNVPCEELAKNLLGKVLVRVVKNGPVLKGRIVETECYLGGDDRASHSYNGKRTPRNTAMYMKPGTAYVYFTYGMYFCFNISSQGDGAAVLIRAVDPLEGHGFMNLQRINKRKSMKKNSNNSKTDVPVPDLKLHDLCNGPGKLCISFGIDEKSCNMQDLSSWAEMWIESDSESGNVGLSDFVTSSRIGIDSVGGEWVLKPLRFYVFGNRSVSRRDRKREGERLRSIQ